MSIKPKFSKINDIIGKAWLASLDDSEGYVLSFKLIEQNSSSPVSLEKEQEEKKPLKESKSTEKPKLTYNPTQTKLCRDLTDVFLKEQTTFRLFIEEVNYKTAHLNISGIKYEDLKRSNNENNKDKDNKNKEENSSISGKISDLTRKFGDCNRLPLLEDIFEDFKKSIGLL